MFNIIACCAFLIANFHLAIHSMETAHETASTARYDKHQGILIEKILEFLPADAHRLVDKRGICNGLASLWAYCKYLSDQPKTSDATRDDYEFFKKAEYLLLQKPLSEFTLDDRSTVDRFIQHALFFQNWAWLNLTELPVFKQLNLEHTLEDTKGRKAIKVLEVRLVGTEEIIQKRLDRLTSIPGNMIFIASNGNKSGHITALYRDGTGQEHFYDPNSRDGDENTSGYSLVKRVWDATELNADRLRKSVEDVHFRNLDIYVYNFGEACDFGDLRINTAEKEQIQKDKGYIIDSAPKLKSAFESQEVARATPQDYAQIFKDKYQELNPADQASSIHSEILNCSLMQRDEEGYTRWFQHMADKIKGAIVSGISIYLSDALDPYLLEVDQIEILRLLLENKPSELEAYARTGLGQAIATDLSAPFNNETPALVLSKTPESGVVFTSKYFRVGGRHSILDRIFYGAIHNAYINLVRFILSPEIPENYRPCSEIVGKAIYKLVVFHPRPQHLAVLRYLLSEEVPEFSKPEKFWLDKAKEACAKELGLTYEYREETKDVLRQMLSMLP